MRAFFFGSFFVPGSDKEDHAEGRRGREGSSGYPDRHMCASFDRAFLLSDRFASVLSAKALEMFLAMIIDEASKVSTQRGSKKVEAYHLCVAIDTFSIFVD
jgi:hypothetical protein